MPFKKSFKLYLCECGAHKGNGRHRFPYRFHLAKHEGYDLHKVDRFFMKYGSSILTITKMIKIGFTVTAHFKLLEGIESIEKTLGVESRNMGSFLDDTISMLKARTKEDSELVERTSLSTQMNFSNLEALEGADLRQLESFLRSHDQERVFGNLNRIVTPDGHVKWVCIDHYKENYRRTAVRRLMEIVEALDDLFFVIGHVGDDQGSWHPLP
ncbi:hypothetical protein BGZ65_001928 [Modicella reniformis]|uniref:Uncharacterized protein n=1 Tax=Modicella reniformis TaxID=1440133 RepID=A0A9P6MJB1_9FUNG|nr:hypothetical protein BGZ65_001928 [Modicella reniformis]